MDFKKNELASQEEPNGEYLTKRVILECYDAMAEAMKSGRSYQTILDPPPADPCLAHKPMQGLGFNERGTKENVLFYIII